MKRWRLRLSALAQADTDALLAVSRERWGDEGHARYAALLSAALGNVAASPTGPTTRARDELALGVRSFHLRHTRPKHGVRTPVHVIFFRALDHDVIEIVRVLHERMDPTGHVEPRPPTKRRTRR